MRRSRSGRRLARLGKTWISASQVSCLLLFWRGLIAEHVTPPAHREDNAWPVSLQFATQFHDVDLQRIRKSIIFFIPHLLVDRRPRQHFARITKKQNQ